LDRATPPFLTGKPRRVIYARHFDVLSNVQAGKQVKQQRWRRIKGGGIASGGPNRKASAIR